MTTLRCKICGKYFINEISSCENKGDGPYCLVCAGILDRLRQAKTDIAEKAKEKYNQRGMESTDKIFSGEYSRKMWDEVNKGNFRDALYFVCCRIQELEDKLASQLSVKKEDE